MSIAKIPITKENKKEIACLKASLGSHHRMAMDCFKIESNNIIATCGKTMCLLEFKDCIEKFNLENNGVYAPFFTKEFMFLEKVTREFPKTSLVLGVPFGKSTKIDYHFDKGLLNSIVTAIDEKHRVFNSQYMKNFCNYAGYSIIYISFSEKQLVLLKCNKVQLYVCEAYFNVKKS
jgi:hypothetical protein